MKQFEKIITVSLGLKLCSVHIPQLQHKAIIAKLGASLILQV